MSRNINTSVPGTFTGGGSQYTVVITIPADVESVDDPLPGLPREIPLIFDNVGAAAATLNCEGDPCLPGGLNLLFQGLWHDPVTGIAYARNRWYDARTASWLSEDPMGSVDSPNLYAFVGWQPHAATDPLGLLSEEEITRIQARLAERIDELGLTGEARAKAELNATLYVDSLISQDADEAIKNAQAIDERPGDWFEAYHALGEPREPAAPPTYPWLFSVGVAGTISPPFVFGSGGFNLNVGYDFGTNEFTGISITADLSGGGSTGLGASSAGVVSVWPNYGRVFDLNGTTYTGGAALAGGAGAQANAIWTNSPVPSGGQVGFTLGLRGSTITGVDVVGGIGHTATVIGYDRRYGWAFISDEVPK